MNLLEILDLRADLDWQEQGSFIMAAFSSGGLPYQVQLQGIHLPVKELAGKDIRELSFLRLDKEGDSPYSVSSDSQDPFAVYSIVVNGVLELIESGTVKIDGLFFSSEDRHATNDRNKISKPRLYASMASRIAKKTGWKLYEARHRRSTEFLLVAENLTIYSPDFVDIAESMRLPIPTVNT